MDTSLEQVVAARSVQNVAGPRQGANPPQTSCKGQSPGGSRIFGTVVVQWKQNRFHQETSAQVLVEDTTATASFSEMGIQTKDSYRGVGGLRRFWNVQDFLIRPIERMRWTADRAGDRNYVTVFPSRSESATQFRQCCRIVGERLPFLLQC